MFVNENEEIIEISDESEIGEEPTTDIDSPNEDEQNIDEEYAESGYSDEENDPEQSREPSYSEEDNQLTDHENCGGQHEE